MKTINKIFLGLGLIGLNGLYSCSDFDEINSDPSKTPITSVKPQYALNQSIGKSMMDPSTGERVIVYNWGDAARLIAEKRHLCIGSYTDDFMTSFYYPCISEALTTVTLAIEVTDNEDIPKSGNEVNFYPNVKQFARIWRAYLISQFSDSFGPYALNAGTGDNPTFNSVEDVYGFMLAELKEAASLIDTSVTPTEEQAKCDPFYGYNAQKWIRYANSLRMRLAMRLTNVKPEIARQEFEDAIRGGNYIATLADMQAVEQNNGWNDYTGPYSRTYNQHCLSSAMNNILTNLGGVPVASQRPDLQQYVKPANYLGVKYEKHFLANTDNPTKQMWMDGIPNSLDPRALKLFYLPGDENAENKVTNRGTRNANEYSGLLNPSNNKDTIKVNAFCAWNGMPAGIINSFSPSMVNNLLWSNATARITNFPILGAAAANATEKQIFFGPWESYFLLAEASIYGWNTGTTAQTAYETGVKLSFEHFGVSEFANEYLASEAYNRVGTSVKFTHTAEPVAEQMEYIDGYTNEAKTVAYQYPVASKTLYGQALNDQLAKIITQKYIAQMPYLVLECWSDYRRLGLPFFDMIVNENPLSGDYDMRSYWSPESWESGQTWKYFPQRMRYPSSLRNADPEGYAYALELLGGDDTTMTPLWWAKH